MFGAPAADREGNLYLDNASVIAETFDIIRAARKNGGRVIANVGCMVEKGAGKVVIPAQDVDAIVFDPNCEQALSIKHRKYWSLFTTHSDVPLEEAISRLRFVNRVLRITPRRTAVDNALARLAALIFAENARKGMLRKYRRRPARGSLPDALRSRPAPGGHRVHRERRHWRPAGAGGLFWRGGLPEKDGELRRSFSHVRQSTGCDPARRARSR